MQETTLDPQAVNLAKAIRQTESGGNFAAQGKSGEFGAYQFTEPTWNAQASKFGINVPLKQATPEQQNAVAYNQIKAWKDAGHNVAQIASMWNAGQGEPDAYTGKFSNGKASAGTNSYGVKFSVPDYAYSVANAYQNIKGGGQQGADPNNPSSTGGNPAADVPNSGFLGTNPNDSLYGKIIDNSITRGIQSFFPGQKVGQAIGTLGGYAASGFDPNYDISAPTPLQVAGDVAQGALMVGTGQPEGTAGLSVFGKTVPVLQTAETALPSIAKGTIGRIAQNTLLGGAYGATGAMAGGSTNIKDIATQGAIGGAVGGVAGGVVEGVNKALDTLPSRITKSILPQLQNEDTINYAIKNVKLGSTETMVTESQKALTSYNKQIDGILSHPQYAEDRIIASDILTGVKTAFPRSEYDVPTIISKMKNLVPSEAATLTKLGKGGELGLEEANTLRQAIDKATYKTTPFDSPEIKAGKELAQAVGHSIRETVKKIVPETVPIFDGFSKEIRLFKALSSLEKKTGKQSFISMKDLWSMVAGHSVAGVPGSVASLALEKAASVPAVKLGAAKLIQNTAPAIKTTSNLAVRGSALTPGTLSKQ